MALPLTETDFAEVISAEFMVFGRKGVGGPQLAEVNRMLASEGERAAAESAWVQARSGDLARREVALEQAFAALAAR